MADEGLFNTKKGKYHDRMANRHSKLMEAEKGKDYDAHDIASRAHVIASHAHEDAGNLPAGAAIQTQTGARESANVHSRIAEFLSDHLGVSDDPMSESNQKSLREDLHASMSKLSDRDLDREANKAHKKISASIKANPQRLSKSKGD